MTSPFTAQLILDLEAVLSPPRFRTYVRASSGDRARAMALYCWNTDVAAALYTPLQFAEITVRNGALDAIVPEFGTNWHRARGFHYTLPVTVRRMRVRAHLQDIARRHARPGSAVAELKFAFWQHLFVTAQDPRLWDKHLRTAFPAIPAQLTVAEARQQIHDNIQTVRDLRNRIAHHEPIISCDLAADLDAALALIEWRRPTVAAWIRTTERVSGLLAMRP